MSGKELFEGMSYVDERFVDEAENKTIPKRMISPWLKVASMAACLCLICFSIYHLNQLQDRDVTDGAAADSAAVQENPGEGLQSGLESELKQDSLESAMAAEDRPVSEDRPASRAPEMVLRVEKMTDTGFIGTVTEPASIGIFDVDAELTVVWDPAEEAPEGYDTGSLVHVMFTSWDEEAMTIVASMLGVVEEPSVD